MLVEELVAKVLSEARGLGLRLEDYGVGLRYCYALVVDEGSGRKALGLAYVPIREIGHDVLPEGVGLEDALELVLNASLLRRALGIAIANAISQSMLDPGGLDEGDILDHLDLRPDDKVVLVGYIRPVYEALRDEGLDITVLERDPMLRPPWGLPDTMLPRALVKATVCLATGSCLVNDTLDLVAHYARGCRIRALIGPTAQLLPALLHGVGFTHVASIYVREPGAAARAVRRGGGTRELLRYSVKYVSKAQAY
ncbi:hypothetical protein DRO32_03255 [Candidatus Bathyarchaeota archaeon]|nr:MAG: hypothetical protein DRO32_03255 [Candidatus Bathyarchaeota archaeon]